MANSLNIELEGKVVVLKPMTLKPEHHDIKSRLFKVTGGFGSSSFTMGRALFGTFLVDGERTRMDGYDVERLATDKEIALVG